jgi:bifunctional DNase/RNase
MNKELQVYGYKLTEHEITHIRLIQLKDKQEKTMLSVPMNGFAVISFFRCRFRHKTDPSIPAHKMFINIIDILGGKIRKVVIDRLNVGIFLATMYLIDRNGKEHLVNLEANDAIAMAFIMPCEIFVMESIIDQAKNDRENRVNWYDPKDDKSLDTVRTYDDDELLALPHNELEQLLDITTGIEDFEFAARLKKALDSPDGEQSSTGDAIRSIII